MLAGRIFWRSVEKKKYVFGNLSQRMFHFTFRKCFFEKQIAKHKKENPVSWRNEVKQRIRKTGGENAPHFHREG